MIVFCDNIETVNYMIGNMRNYNYVILNLSSYYNRDTYSSDISSLATYINMLGNKANAMGIPLNQYIETPDFDISYAEAIFNDNMLFVQFMKIMIPAFEDYNVFVLVGTDIYREAITESLTKLIQQRYGYNCWRISDINDLIGCSLVSTFSYEGLDNMDSDRDRYAELFINNMAPPLSSVMYQE